MQTGQEPLEVDLARLFVTALQERDDTGVEERGKDVEKEPVQVEQTEDPGERPGEYRSEGAEVVEDEGVVLDRSGMKR